MASLDSQELNMPVLFEKKNYMLKVIFNRPRKLNSLTKTMVRQISDMLKAYENDPAIKAIMLKARGKIFCTGGDLAELYQSVSEGNFSICFWRRLILLGYQIATYKKTQIALIDGLAMGAGVVLSMHHRFRIVTENTIFALPEVGLGTFPAGGITHIVSRLSGSQALMDLPLLEKALCENLSTDITVISRIIHQFAQEPSRTHDNSYDRLDIINNCFSKSKAEDILSSLEYEATKGDDKWISETLDSIKKASPTSLKVTLELIRKARTQTLEQSLILEDRVACYMAQRNKNTDAAEGARALIFQRDGNPQWKPSSLQLVTREMVNRHFSKTHHDGYNPLALHGPEARL